MHDIALASTADLDSITALLQANAPSQGGTLTGEFPRDKVARMMAAGMPVVVAHRDGQVVGVLFSGPRNDPAAPPPVQAMWAAWPGSPGAYVYGPVCIADSERGQGLLPRLYAALQTHCPGCEAVLFIRRDNAISLRAHLRLGMQEVAGYTLDSVDYAVLTSATG
ncbi:N-acetyltransferase [Crenobacter sp. SG2305]|uniref:GNAT family N-acetyltransferase n=1 Tax=Crenobacter oryzisoli TaxID=3056844 RepID=UPI0025AAF115|nr:GNAT family N-acetyltransferase [Crenobacter sp. SG2305]MDN0082876.1 N-acetyltransferase [Crenobacter sp. SG2305]